MIETQREMNDDPVKGTKVTMEKAAISSEDYKKFLNSFASAEEAWIYSVKKAEDFQRDIIALIESMNTLFQESFIPLTLLDVEVDVIVHVCGKVAIQSRLGHKNSDENVMKFVQDSAKEGD